MFFFVAMIYFGMYPLDVMTFEFSAPHLTETVDVDPDIDCYRGGKEKSPTIFCRVQAMEGIGYIEVENKGKTVLTDRDAPFEFRISESDLEAVVGQKNFHIVLRGKDGQMIRRYVRSASMLDGPDSGDTDPFSSSN